MNDKPLLDNWDIDWIKYRSYNSCNEEEVYTCLTQLEILNKVLKCYSLILEDLNNQKICISSPSLIFGDCDLIPIKKVKEILNKRIGILQKEKISGRENAINKGFIA